MDASRRDLLKAAAVLLVDQVAMSRRFAFADEPAGGPAKDERKVIVWHAAESASRDVSQYRAGKHFLIFAAT